MKSTRRGFLGRALTIATAVSLAPAVTVDAAPVNVVGAGGAPCHQCDAEAAFPHVYGHPEAPNFEVTTTDAMTGNQALTLIMARAIDPVIIRVGDKTYVNAHFPPA